MARNLTSSSGIGISRREALFRFMGVLMLVVIAYVHLMDISHKIQEGVWYMTFLFVGLIVASLILAVALVRTDSSRVRFAWVGAAIIAFGAIFGFCVSRAIPLPGMADHHGDWFGTLGVFAGLLEAGLIGLAGYALRDRVRMRDARQRTQQRVRRTATAFGLYGLVFLQPTLAFAHGGEEMTEEEMAHADMGHDPGAMNEMGQHPDPLLGGTELGIAFFLASVFVVWAGFTLFARTNTPPRRPLVRVSARDDSAPAM